MENKKQVDESYKKNVEEEKKAVEDSGAGQGSAMEVNFLNYITSLIFQTMIFLGEIPNPMSDNKIEQNLVQAKFLIDTLVLLREKTKGNLEKPEEDMLNTSICELQMKYVANSKNALKDVSGKEEA